MTTFKCPKTGDTIAVVHTASGRILEPGDKIECVYRNNSPLKEGEFYTYVKPDEYYAQYKDNCIFVEEATESYWASRFGCVVVEVNDDNI